ncbi:hypothetical protein [Levilactobacillus sp. N40-8-2]|uniref:hypothetical protein n=1 Tax=Levilactobacillus muriae TaxID=3238987 RepID=UPI0038B29213
MAKVEGLGVNVLQFVALDLMPGPGDGRSLWERLNNQAKTIRIDEVADFLAMISGGFVSSWSPAPRLS